MVSLTAKAYWPADAGLPLDTASAAELVFGASAAPAASATTARRV